MEALGGTHPGPAEVSAAAHAAAELVVDAGRATDDPELVARLVVLVDDLGLDTLATLWSQRPARTLPGALWRLYVLREWVRRQPAEASREYTAGMTHAPVSHAIAGPADPVTPGEVRDLADRILRGVFDGDLAVALERAASFARVVSTGRAASEPAVDLSPHPAPDAAPSPHDDGHEGDRSARSAAHLLTMAEDLEAAATLWRDGRLT
ncbi:hypothetical protein [Janibacter sp. G1551]|uniref:hypothetical protein n=1 Tax=Janibacter sp. G1551 TaxID=3420440 RepID=UPI003D08F515